MEIQKSMVCVNICREFSVPFTSFVTRATYNFNIKNSWSKLVSTRRSSVLSLPFQ